MVIDQEFEKQLQAMHFFDEENRDGYVVSKELKKIWAVELDLLRDFIRVCDQYNLRFYLDGGSLLGAIRHKGYIPWDDDIDIVMPREDYDKLLQIASDEFKAPYEFQSPYHMSNYPRSHVQIRNITTTAVLSDEVGCYNFNQGIFIDIFPLDVVPDNTKALNKYMRHTFILSMLRRLKYHFFSNNHKFMRFASHVLSVLIPKRVASFERYEKYCKKYSGLQDCLMEAFAFREGVKSKLRYIHSEWYTDSIIVPFEMFNITIPAGYNNVLTNMYGPNYMTPVKNPSYHGHVIFDTDKPYDSDRVVREYKK